MTEPKSATDLVAQQRAADLEKRTEWMKTLSDFDWKKLPPHLMAQILTKKPYKGKSGEPDYYLSPEQALVFALRSFELDLSPLSSEVWFDRDRWTTNVTLEGQIVLARRRGMTSAPVFVNVERPWKKGQPPLQGYEKEPGKTCTVKVGDGECSYTAWLSEWFMPMSPVWKAKTDHMLTVRSYEKALEFSGGVGVSGMPDDRNILGAADEPLAQITAESVKPTGTVERMPYASPGWKPPADYAKHRGGFVEAADRADKNFAQQVQGLKQQPDLERTLTESIKQAQEKK